MPIVVALAPELIVAFFVLLGLSATIPQWHEPQLHGVLSVLSLPAKLLARGYNATLRAVQNSIDTWVNAKALAVRDWLYALGVNIGDNALGVAHFAARMVEGIHHLTHVTVHDIVKAFLAPVRALAHEAHSLATMARTEAVNAYSMANDAFTYARHVAFDVIIPRIEEIESVEIPSALRRVGKLENQAGQFAANFAQLESAHLIRSVGAIEAELPKIINVTNVLSTAEDLAGLAAVGSIATDLVRWYKECKPSRACYSNSTSGDLESLLSSSLPALELSAMLAMIEGIQQSMPTVVGFIEEFISGK